MDGILYNTFPNFERRISNWNYWKLTAGQLVNSKTMIIEKTLNIMDKKLFVLKIYGF